MAKAEECQDLVLPQSRALEPEGLTTGKKAPRLIKTDAWLSDA